MINSFDYSQYYYRLKEIYDEKESIWGCLKKKETLESGNSSVGYEKLVVYSQKGGFCLGKESIDVLSKQEMNHW